MDKELLSHIKDQVEKIVTSLNRYKPGFIVCGTTAKELGLVISENIYTITKDKNMEFNITPVGNYHNVDIKIDSVTIDFGLLNKIESYKLANTLVSAAYELLKCDSDKFFELCDSEGIERRE